MLELDTLELDLEELEASEALEALEALEQLEQPEDCHQEAYLVGFDHLDHKDDIHRPHNHHPQED